ncbi:MAG TPA: HAMP domain-containing protein [Mucilaginibacter sp.]|jgi:nitrogen fixation/metabolism regulation signal transduction histidine kinase
MKIRKKLFLGFGLLFIVVLFFGVVSIYYIEEISETSKITIKNNYETLAFTREMRSVLDKNEFPLPSGAAQRFDNALKKQENNITELGEKEATAGVRNGFRLLSNPSVSLAQKQRAVKDIRSLLETIDGLNLHAIVLKNDSTHETVNKATLYLGVMAFITFLILFVLIANFPGFIIDPLHELAEGLQEVGQKNYDVRLDLTTSDEFVQLSNAFNTMAAALGEFENTSLTKILSEEIRIKTLIEETPDVVIGLNEKQEVLFMNTAAKNILNLGDKQVTGKAVNELRKNNNLLKVILDNKDLDDPLKIDLDGKISYFQQKNIEVVVPNLKLNTFDSVQFSGFSAGMIYVLKEAPEVVSSER